MTTSEKYLYIFSRRPEYTEISRLEMRSFFGEDILGNVYISSEKIEPSRSPYMKERMEILFESENFDSLLQYAKQIQTGQKTYKILCLNNMHLNETPKMERAKRQEIERSISMEINGVPDLKNPDIVWAVAEVNGVWYFGTLTEGEAIWLHHQKKPQTYSTSLNTIVARAIVNIAVPHPTKDIRVIDPCCGIGTVLVEALSMGIPIEGRDMNPFVCVGSRKNIAHFGFEGKVTLGPIEEITDIYDVAIIDMPYNVFTHISKESQFDIIQSARKIAKKVVFVTIETIDDMLQKAGFSIKDRCTVQKQSFIRQVLVCW